MRPRLAATTAVTTSLVAMLAACAGDDGTASDTTVAPTTTVPVSVHPADLQVDHDQRAAAMLATAGFQDVATAEAAGYAGSLDALGCFQDPERGGMGVHYIDEQLMDGEVDITRPEALVYELGPDGRVASLVAHEYIVPTDAWEQSEPPTLFGRAFHQHPTLPLLVLHAWLWKDNPSGPFEDWNPAVRLCPAGVPIFGRDRPEPPTPNTESTVEHPLHPR